VSLDPSQQRDLADHAIRDQPVFPAAGFLVLAAQVAVQEGLALQLGPLHLERPLRLGDGARQLQLVLEQGSLAFHSLDPDNRSAGWSCHGRVDLAPAPSPLGPGAAGLAPEAAPFTPSEAPAEADNLDTAGFYGALARCGLNYGPRFRGLQRVQRQDGQAWAELVRPAGGGVEGLLDSCFQLVAACLDPEAAGGQLFLPIGLDALSMEALEWPERFLCEVRLEASPEPALVHADLIWHAPVPGAHGALGSPPPAPGAIDQGPVAPGRVLGWIRGFRLRRLPRQAVDWMFPSTEQGPPEPALDPASWLLQSDWSPMAQLAPSPAASAPDLADLAEGPLLQERPLVIGAADHQVQAFGAWANVQGQAPWRLGFGEPLPAGSGPVLVWPDPATAEPLALVTQLLALVQQLQAPGPLGQATPGSESPHLESGAGEAPARRQARPLWLVLEGDGPWTGVLAGFAQTAALETPQLAWTRLHLPADPLQQPLADDWASLWRLAEAEASLRWQGGQPQGQRLQRLGRERFRVVNSDPGRLDTLVHQAIAPNRLLTGELEVAVEATGLNFRDVLNALGLLAAYGEELGLAAGAQMPFGGECVGRVLAVGPGVDPALVGQRVLAALAVGSLASHVTCRADLCLPLPAGLDPETGASLSTVFSTALYGLVTLAQLQPGETVLIHAGAGGVGQAALQVARRCGARILATASAPKQQGLLDQGWRPSSIRAAWPSPTRYWPTPAAGALTWCSTASRGTGWRPASGPWLRAGVSLNWARSTFWSRAQAQERRPDAAYLPFDLLEVAAAEPQLVRQLLLGLLADLEQGVYQPIPIEVFPITAVQEAFRLLAQARHRGKVVIRLADRAAPLVIAPQATYLISGALGGIGLRLIDWLVQRGASSLLLVSRSAANPAAEAQTVLDSLQARGIRCAQVPLDLGAGPDSPATTTLAKAIRALPLANPCGACSMPLGCSTTAWSAA
jgi:NADPH:quinone reductase-like Zn-dependent oxidoreductase